QRRKFVYTNPCPCKNGKTKFQTCGETSWSCPYVTLVTPSGGSGFPSSINALELFRPCTQGVPPIPPCVHINFLSVYFVFCELYSVPQFPKLGRESVLGCRITCTTSATFSGIEGAS